MKPNYLPLSEYISHEPVFIEHSGFFLAEGLLFIPVPEWEGWKCIDLKKGEPIDHFARWKFYFPPRNKHAWFFLPITWPSVSHVVLGFVYPDDRRILEMIASRRRLALVDHSLIRNLSHTFASDQIDNRQRRVNRWGLESRYSAKIWWAN